MNPRNGGTPSGYCSMGSAAGKQGQKSPTVSTHSPEAIPSSRPQSRAHQSNVQGRAPQQTAPSRKSSRSLSLLSLDEDSQDSMVCESCSVNFTIFKKKNRCLECTKLFCTNCFCKGPHRCCKTCNMFIGLKDRGQLMQFKVKDLRQYLSVRDISTTGCREKGDLVDLVVQYLATKNGSALMVTVNNLDDVPVPTTMAQPRPSQPTGQGASVRREPASGHQTQAADIVRQTNPATVTVETANTLPQAGQETTGDSQRTSDMGITRNTWTEGSSSGSSEAEQIPVTSTVSPQENTKNEAETQAQPKHRASISDLKTIEDVSTLSVRQLKEILTVNFVNYKGCVERWELEDRVKMLYVEKQEIKSKEEAAASATFEHTGTTDEDLTCKICMDSPIDCVLLECGHMVTCTKCGKQLAECPLCRQYIVRAVHVFRS